MHSKFIEHLRSFGSRQNQLSSYNNPDSMSAGMGLYNSSNYGNNPLLQFIIVRHGERVDATFGVGWTRQAFNYNGQYYPFHENMPPTLPLRNNLLDYEIDTPLTKTGLQQSWNVGSLLSKYNLPIVACYSSPAIRSIQTADQILAGLNRRLYTPLRIELGLFECSSWYARSPINFMTDHELVSAGFNIDRSYHSQIRDLPLLENEYQYYERSKETMKKLIKFHKKTGGTVLIVAHAPSLEVLTRHLMNGSPRPERLNDLAARVGYCSMTIIDGSPASKLWNFRYSLDEPPNLQFQQTNSLIAPFTENLSFGNTQLINPNPQYQFVTTQDLYSPNFAV